MRIYAVVVCVVLCAAVGIWTHSYFRDISFVQEAEPVLSEVERAVGTINAYQSIQDLDAAAQKASQAVNRLNGTWPKSAINAFHSVLYQVEEARKMWEGFLYVGRTSLPIGHPCLPNTLDFSLQMGSGRSNIKLDTALDRCRSHAERDLASCCHLVDEVKVRSDRSRWKMFLAIIAILLTPMIAAQDLGKRLPGTALAVNFTIIVIFILWPVIELC